MGRRPLGKVPVGFGTSGTRSFSEGIGPEPPGKKIGESSEVETDPGIVADLAAPSVHRGASPEYGRSVAFGRF